MIRGLYSCDCGVRGQYLCSQPRFALGQHVPIIFDERNVRLAARLQPQELVLRTLLLVRA